MHIIDLVEQASMGHSYTIFVVYLLFQKGKIPMDLLDD